MNNGPSMVAVDVGNSFVKLALLRDQLIIDHAISITSADWESDVICWVQDQLAGGQPQWRVATVHLAAAARLTDALRQMNPDTSIHLVTRRDVPMQLDVDQPDRLGIDRLLGAYAASVRMDMPAVVIDAGSAITVDWVSPEGRFGGGAILPGIGLQAGSLAAGTEALPQIRWNVEGAICLPAKNTEDAIRSGILAGACASIDGLIARYRDVAGMTADQVRVVLTGGDRFAISPHLRHIHQVIPNLVCRGLLDLPRSLVGQSNTCQEPR